MQSRRNYKVLVKSLTRLPSGGSCCEGIADESRVSLFLTEEL